MSDKNDNKELLTDLAMSVLIGNSMRRDPEGFKTAVIIAFLLAMAAGMVFFLFSSAGEWLLPWVIFGIGIPLIIVGVACLGVALFTTSDSEKMARPTGELAKMTVTIEGEFLVVKVPMLPQPKTRGSGDSMWIASTGLPKRTSGKYKGHPIYVRLDAFYKV